ncbi:MAG TPA: hypothetical protein VE981_02665 [Planctomycetota bacterium]|nr:hypothetical protein [Planctomycetota bacterium]
MSRNARFLRCLVAAGLLAAAAGCSKSSEGGARPPVAERDKLPPLPDGVTELKFAEFYRMPVGPRGLEYTERLESLRGKKVRIAGYMVRQVEPAARTLLLAAKPMSVHEDDYGFCDDLPPQILHVLTPDSEPSAVPFTPGILLLTGRLDLGPRQEPDGRVSHVRLFLDPPARKSGQRG